MNRSLHCGVLTLLCCLPLAASAADDELQRLRNENAELVRQLDALAKRCPVAAESATAIPPPPAATAPVPAPTPGPQSSASIAVKPAAEPPPGYKLVPLDPSDKPYASTGCTKGLFAGTGPDAAWKHSENWEALQKGMKPAEVEALLGVEHFDVQSAGRIGWHYGRCGKSSLGLVVFGDNGVQFWTTPNF